MKTKITIKINNAVSAGAPTALKTPKIKSISSGDYEHLSILQKDEEILEVNGNSMKSSDIFNGDRVLIQKNTKLKNNNIVIGGCDGKYTLKKFKKGGFYSYLFSEQNNILLKRKEIDIYGVVKSIIPTSKKRGNIKKKSYFFKNNISIFKKDILKFNDIPSSSVDLIITSPPYNVDIGYNSNKDDLSYKKYLEFTREWIKKCYTLAKDDGRFCLNIPLDKNKGGQQSVCADITNIAKKIGWKYHSTIVWNEGNISRRTAWGSWMSASAPYVIAPVEVILVLYKESWKKENAKERQNDISREDFMSWTNGLWTFNGQNKKGAGGHPAAFPIELPHRCIKLFSFVNDTVFDPFLGSGSTLIAAYRNGRKGVGVDIDKDYCDIAIKRLLKEMEND